MGQVSRTRDHTITETENCDTKELTRAARARADTRHCARKGTCLDTQNSDSPRGRNVQSRQQVAQGQSVRRDHHVNNS